MLHRSDERVSAVARLILRVTESEQSPAHGLELWGPGGAELTRADDGARGGPAEPAAAGRRGGRRRG
jgi:hypothetical protein